LASSFLRIVLTTMMLVSCLLAGVRAGHAGQAGKPSRIVSVNLCTDQLLMLLLEPERIASVTHYARDPSHSSMTGLAAGLPINHARAEEVFILEPDLVLAGTFTASTTVSILRRLGKRVETFPPANSFADIRQNLRRLGDLVGERERAEELIRAFDDDLARLSVAPSDRRPLAVYYYANSFTSGDKTLSDEVLEAAGLRNLGAERGLKRIRKLPLEVLVMSDPDLIIKELRYPAPALANSHFQHPALRYLRARSDEEVVAGQYTLCGTPFTVRAIGQLAGARKRLNQRSSAQLNAATTAGRPAVVRDR